MVSLAVKICFTFPGIVVFPLSSFSQRTEAYPTLSDEISLFVLFILVGCTANQFITPMILSLGVKKRTWARVLSVSYLYLESFNVTCHIDISTNNLVYRVIKFYAEKQQVKGPELGQKKITLYFYTNRINNF